VIFIANPHEDSWMMMIDMEDEFKIVLLKQDMRRLATPNCKKALDL
jgi:hypothetical protein